MPAGGTTENDCAEVRLLVTFFRPRFASRDLRGVAFEFAFLRISPLVSELFDYLENWSSLSHRGCVVFFGETDKQVLMSRRR
jgi:hypothetical protein